MNEKTPYRASVFLKIRAGIYIYIKLAPVFFYCHITDARVSCKTDSGYLKILIVNIACFQTVKD